MRQKNSHNESEGYFQLAGAQDVRNKEAFEGICHRNAQIERIDGHKLQEVRTK